MSSVEPIDPLTEEGIVQNLGGFIDEYYAAADYTTQDIPTPQRLSEVGLTKIISYMEKIT